MKKMVCGVVGRCGGEGMWRWDRWRVGFFFQAEDGIRDAQESRGLGDVYKRQNMASIKKAKNIHHHNMVFVPLNQPPRSKLSRHEMNVIISQQATKNEQSFRVSGITMNGRAPEPRYE